MSEPIHVLASPNEQQSPKRVAALWYAIENAPIFQWDGYEEIVGDLKFWKYWEQKDGPRYPTRGNGDLLIVNVEVKEINDLWASKEGKKGHLGDQVKNMLAEREPAFIAVLGSLDEVHRACPWVSSPGGKAAKRTDDNRLSDQNTERAMDADFEAVNIPVWYLSSNRELAYQYILSRVKNVLNGGNISQWMPRFPVDSRAYGALCMAVGVGDSTAKALLLEYGSIANLCTASLDDLASFKQDGRRIGPKKAEAIIKLLHSEVPSRNDPHIKERA
ncbi:hypothetical protein M0R72_19145 [Candidatus Pacearchaeota archaeon]|jgi:hypothetical protein|nr:hypothetical protein [Candidatus Pacearchaeota archaeon]